MHPSTSQWGQALPWQRTRQRSLRRSFDWSLYEVQCSIPWHWTLHWKCSHGGHDYELHHLQSIKSSLPLLPHNGMKDFLHSMRLHFHIFSIFPWLQFFHWKNHVRWVPLDQCPLYGPGLPDQLPHTTWAARLAMLLSRTWLLLRLLLYLLWS